MEGSKPFQLNQMDMERVAKGALVALAGAAAVYIAQTVPQIDFGIWTPLAVAVSGIIVNAIRVWVADNSR